MKKTTFSILTIIISLALSNPLLSQYAHVHHQHVAGEGHDHHHESESEESNFSIEAYSGSIMKGI